MYMRMLLVEMSGYKELCVPYAHPSHVFQSYFCHNPAGQPAFILFGKSQCNVSDRSGYFRIHAGLCFESLCYCVNILNEQAGMCDNPGILFTVNDIAGNLTESASLYNLRNHSRIWFSSSSILATCTRHSSFAVSNPPAFAL